MTFLISMGTSPPTFSENSRLQIMVEPSDYQRRIRYHTTERIVEEKLSSSYALHPKPVRASREQIGTPPRSSGDGRVLASTADVPDDKRAHCPAGPDLEPANRNTGISVTLARQRNCRCSAGTYSCYGVGYTRKSIGYSWNFAGLIPNSSCGALTLSLLTRRFH